MLPVPSLRAPLGLGARSRGQRPEVLIVTPHPPSFSQTNSSCESNRTASDPGDILDNPALPFYEAVLGLSALGLACVGVCSAATFTRATRTASTALHNNLFSKVGAGPARAGPGRAAPPLEKS